MASLLAGPKLTIDGIVCCMQVAQKVLLVMRWWLGYAARQCWPAPGQVWIFRVTSRGILRRCISTRCRVINESYIRLAKHRITSL